MPRRWNFLLFVVLLVAQLLLLAATETTRDSRLERWLLQVQAPVVHAGSGAASGLLGSLDGVRLNRTLRQQNGQLRDELAAAQGELLRLQNVEDELQRLSRAVDYTRRDAGSFFVAEVVYVDQASSLRTLVLYTGTEQPRRNQAVRTPQGLVGRVIVPAGRYAKVQLITDRASSVSAMVERTRRKGMVRGTTGGGLELALLPRLADVQPGDRVVTAGIDGVYPRGIPIGTVGTVVPSEGLFLKIDLEPAIDLGLLEQVYVLTTEPVPADIIEGDLGFDDLDQNPSPSPVSTNDDAAPDGTPDEVAPDDAAPDDAAPDETTLDDGTPEGVSEVRASGNDRGGNVTP